MAHLVFISHSSKDKVIADQVCTRLEARGIKCWIAPRDVHPGSPYSEEIIDGIQNARVMVLVLSANANASPHIPKEIERSVSLGIPIIPFRVEAVMPGRSLDYFISSVHWLDASTPPMEPHLETLASTVLSVLTDKPRNADKSTPVATSATVTPAPAESKPADDKTKRVGDYEILGELGSGGMGRVYRVRNVISDRVEAMKILLPDLAGRQELAERFLREIKVLASLNHPNIASLRTALTVDNQLIMIMEYVEGTSLASRLERGPIPAPDALNYIDQVLNALSYAHQHNVIHRDIKPANMMLTPQGVVKLMDFGIARTGEERGLTISGTTLGSINYMSPEQVKGETADARSDLYSVGVSLYEMVTGRRPFQQNSDYSIMAAHVQEAPRPPMELAPGLPPALSEIILMAMAKDPAQRFQSADAFRNALRSVRPLPIAQSTSGITTAAMTVPAVPAQTPAPIAATGTPVVAHTSGATPVPSATVPPPMPVPPPSHRGLYMTLGALIVLAVLVIAGIYWPGRGKADADAAKTTMATTAPAKPIAIPKPTAAVGQIPTPAPPAVDGAPSIAPETMTPASKGVQAASLRTPELTPKAPKPAAPPQAAPENAAKPNAQELDEVEHHVDQLTSRANSVNRTLDGMQAQQAASGYGLRSDMALRQESMKLNLSKAQAAVEQGDVERAKRYGDLAEADIEALEHFLHR